MATAFNEYHQIIARNSGGGGILKRVKIEWMTHQHRRIENDIYARFWIINQRKYRHRAGFDAKHLFQQLRFAKTQTAATQHPVKMVEGNARALQRRDNPERAFFAFQKKDSWYERRESSPAAFLILPP